MLLIARKKPLKEKDGYERFVPTWKAAGEPWNKEINFHFQCVEGDGFPENQEFFSFFSRIFEIFLQIFENLFKFFEKYESQPMNQLALNGPDGKKNSNIWDHVKMALILVKMLVAT